MVGSGALLISPNVTPTLFTVSISSLFLAGSVWVFYLSLRLIFINPKKNSNFVSPMGLKAIALIFALIPVVSLITGSFLEKPIIHSIMTIAYIGVILSLLRLAKKRSEISGK